MKKIGKLFGGEDSEELNALYTAIEFCGNGNAYEFLEKTPRTTLTFRIVEALHAHGYKITPTK